MPIPFKILFSNPVHFFALGAGTGLVPIFPGTVGSLLGVLIFWLISYLNWESHWIFHWIALPLLFVFGAMVAGYSARLLDKRDPSCIVIDEIFGVLFALSFAPSGWIWVVVVFVLFRVFDILKPWPINVADTQISGGWGIMLDDLLAGIYTLIVVWLLAFLPFSSSQSMWFLQW